MISREVLVRVEICEMISVVTKHGYFLSNRIMSALDGDYFLEVLKGWPEIDQNEFDQKLKAFIDSNIEETKADVITLFPKRKEIIQCIFDLYITSNYIALIPLMLSQIDGMVKEMTRGLCGLYTIGKDNSLKLLNTKLQFHFFSTFNQIKIENRNEYELLEKDVSNFAKLNRHAILHGESTDFASERNAIKSMALLEFVAELVYANTEIK